MCVLPRLCVDVCVRACVCVCGKWSLLDSSSFIFVAMLSFSYPFVMLAATADGLVVVRFREPGRNTIRSTHPTLLVVSTSFLVVFTVLHNVLRR